MEQFKKSEDKKESFETIEMAMKSHALRVEKDISLAEENIEVVLIDWWNSYNHLMTSTAAVVVLCKCQVFVHNKKKYGKTT